MSQIENDIEQIKRIQKEMAKDFNRIVGHLVQYIDSNFEKKSEISATEVQKYLWTAYNLPSEDEIKD